MATVRIKVDNAKFLASLHSYAERVKKRGRATMFTQARLLVEELMADTPPFASGTFSGYAPRAQKVGQEAVARDIGNAVRLFDARQMPVVTDVRRKAQEQWVARWQALAAKGDLAGMQALASNSKMLKGYTVVKFDGPTQHQSQRDARGHVNKRRYVVAYEVNRYEEYVAMMRRRVGYHKAQLLPAAEALGSRKTAAWIKRFPVTNGSIDLNKAYVLDNPRLTISMHDVKIPQFEERYISRALRNRQIRMETQIQNMMSRGLL